MLYPLGARDLSVLSNKGYTGVGVGAHVPIKEQSGRKLHADRGRTTRWSRHYERPPNAFIALLSH